MLRVLRPEHGRRVGTDISCRLEKG